MRVASRALAAGADVVLLGPERTMLQAGVPVVAVSAVRTGCGKSPIARWLGTRLRARGRRVAVLRHPMPYADLERQRAPALRDARGPRRRRLHHRGARGIRAPSGRRQRGLRRRRLRADRSAGRRRSGPDRLGRREQRFPVPQARSAYRRRRRAAARRRPRLLSGEAVLRTADVIVVNKVDAASRGEVERAIAVARTVNTRAPLVEAASPVRLDEPTAVRGRRVIVVEDGPTITHGQMPHGAGFVAATAGGRDRRRSKADRCAGPPEGVRAVPAHRRGPAGGRL